MAGIIISGSGGAFNPTPQFLPKYDGTTFVDSLLSEFDSGITAQIGDNSLQFSTTRMFFIDSEGSTRFVLRTDNETFGLTANSGISLTSESIALQAVGGILSMSGQLNILNAPAMSAGASAGRWLDVVVDGNQYKIALLSP